MSNSLLPVPLALRLTALALAMFCVLARPMYSTWCQTHQVGHELAELNHQQFRPDSSMERELDAEHARGEHGQLHTDDGGVHVDAAVVQTMPAVQLVAVMNPQDVVLPDPVQRMSTLFRPPIA